MALRLHVRQAAEAKGISLSQLQRRADLGMSTARRMWYGTGDGREDGEPLQYVSLEVLEKIASVLEVEPCDLLVREV
jgi:DNA-binding Xre family transcriptional regulator